MVGLFVLWHPLEDIAADEFVSHIIFIALFYNFVHSLIQCTHTHIHTYSHTNVHDRNKITYT